MERVLHANEETALNPDPFDPVEPEFVAGAVVAMNCVTVVEKRLTEHTHNVKKIIRDKTNAAH
jgi:hypothetical protein